MQKNTTAKFGCLLMTVVGFLSLLGVGCSRTREQPRVIRVHTRIIQDIAHADPAASAGRYCVYCHGLDLAGGAHFEPSCLTCHGQNWQDALGEPSRAPADHSISNQGFMHKNGLFSPQTHCLPCHGSDLGGNVTAGLGFPGCQLCHEQLWLQRTPPRGQF